MEKPKPESGDAVATSASAQSVPDTKAVSPPQGPSHVPAEQAPDAVQATSAQGIPDTSHVPSASTGGVRTSESASSPCWIVKT